jgi:hypothetical protein
MLASPLRNSFCHSTSPLRRIRLVPARCWGRFADPQLRTVASRLRSFRVGQIEVVLALHDVIGELVTDGEPQTIRLTVVTDHVQTAQLRLLACIL